jgi:hypothetical protein
VFRTPSADQASQVRVASKQEKSHCAFASLFLYNAVYTEAWRDGRSESPQYEAGLFNFVTDDEHAPGLLGYADDNWIDGTQSGVFSFVSPGIIESGYGLTSTMIHEYGHHVGMSHPHDGYDSETGIDYGPGGFVQFAWTGDEVNSIMSYIDLNWDFSQFDLDNTNRLNTVVGRRESGDKDLWGGGEEHLRKPVLRRKSCTKPPSGLTELPVLGPARQPRRHSTPRTAPPPSCRRIASVSSSASRVWMMIGRSSSRARRICALKTSC